MHADENAEYAAYAAAHAAAVAALEAMDEAYLDTDFDIVHPDDYDDYRPPAVSPAGDGCGACNDCYARVALTAALPHMRTIIALESATQ